MDERERLRRLGDDPLHDDLLDEPTTVDRIPEPGSEFDDPLARDATPATYDDRLGGETPATPPASVRTDLEDPLPPEAAGGTIGALGGMIAGAVVGGPPGAVVGGIVGAVGGAIVGGAASGEHEDPEDPEDPVTPGDGTSETGLR